jgi:hypothetical protein
VLPIVLDIARGFNVLRQVDAVVSQRDPNAAQDVPRAGLVVNGIEGGDEVKSARLGLLVDRLRSRAMKLTFLLSRCSASTRANLMASSESCGARIVEWSWVRHEVLRCRDKIKDISPSSNSSLSVTVVRIVAKRTSASKRTARREITFSKTTDFERLFLNCTRATGLRDLRFSKTFLETIFSKGHPSGEF